MESLIIAVLGCLAVCAAGLVPGVTPAAAVAVLAAVLMRPFPASRSARLFFAAGGLLLLWAGITLLPLGSLVGDLRSSQWAPVAEFKSVAAAVIPGLAPVDLSGGGSLDVPRRLTLHAPGTGRWLALAAGAWGMFWLTASLRLRQRLRLMKGLVVLGAVVGIAGFVSWYVVPQGDRVCWWYPASLIGGGRALGPFVNRNHFAAFCAMLTPVAMTIAAAPSRRPVLLIRGDSGHLEELCLTEGLFGRVVMSLCLLFLSAATLSSQSRGGTGALLVGLTTAALLWLKSGRTAGVFAGLVGVGAFLLVALWPDTGLQDRLHGMREPGLAIGARWYVWKDALRMWRQLPLAGCGINAFRMFFPRTTTWAAGHEATHAESDVLQYVAEGGLIGVGLIALTGAAWLRMTCRNPFAGARHLLAFGMWRELPDDHGRRAGRHSSSNQVPYAYAVASGGALAAIGFASLVDVFLRVPLALWTTAVLLGLCAPLTRSRRHSLRSRLTWMWPERTVVAVLLAALLTANWMRPGWHWLYRDRQAWLLEAKSAEIVHLLEDCPSYWQAWYELGDRLLAEAETRTPDERDETVIEAGWLALEQAIRCNPRNPRLRENVALRLWAVERWDEARQHRDILIAVLPDPFASMRQWLTREWEAGFRDEARELALTWQGALDEPTRRIELLQWLVRTEMQRGRITQARTWLERILEMDPNNQRALQALAQCERRLGYDRREHQVLRRLVAAHPDDGKAWWRLAELEKVLGHRRHLDKALGEATRLDPRKRDQADRLWKEFVLEAEE